MTAIDSTVIPEFLAEEHVDAVIENGETYVAKMGSPKIVVMTAKYANSTVIPSASISGRTITFNLRQSGDLAYGAPAGFNVLIKGRLG